MSSDEALRITLVCMLPLLCLSRRTVAVSSSPTFIRKDEHPFRDTEVSEQIASVRSTEPTVKKSVPRFRLARSMIDQMTCGLGALKV
jgi:hypothetical protein